MGEILSHLKLFFILVTCNQILSYHTLDSVTNLKGYDWPVNIEKFYKTNTKIERTPDFKANNIQISWEGWVSKKYQVWFLFPSLAQYFNSNHKQSL